MNRTRYLGLSLLTLLCCLTAAAQDPSVTKCEYWFDQQFDSRTTETMTGDTWSSSIDISTLKTGLHSVAFRVSDSDGKYSPTVVKNFILVPGTGTGDNSLSICEYWFDQQFSMRKALEVPIGGIINIDEDISALQSGLHSIAMRVIDKNGIVSSVMVKNFMLVPGTGTGDNALSTCEYWFDQQFSERKSVEVPTDGIINIDEYISALKNGLHNIAMRVIDKNGIVSSVMVKNFMKVEQMDGDNALTTYEYWIDNAFDERESAAVPDGGIVNLNIDISALKQGLHTFNYRTADKAGKVSAVVNKNFFVKKVEGEGKIIGVDYWFNDGPRTRIAIDPAQASIDKNDIVISLDGVQPRSISEDYTFDATTKTVKTTETITFGIQVFNDAEVGTDAVVETLENMTLTVTPLFEALVNEASSTQPAPKGGQVQGFSYAGAVGDVLYWEITGSDAKVDFKDADGNAITPETKEIGGKTVLVVTMPTTTVYVLAYGATTDDDLVVKVAQPVELTVVGATRAYGDANPTFTYTSSGAAVAGEVVFTTTADATSAVGDYTVDIDLTGVTNTYVTVVAGKFTITPSPLTVGVEDCSITQGEELPTFTLTYDGFKNGEDASVLTTQPTVTTEATASSAPGDYDLIVSGGEATNYTFAYTKGKLTIVEATGIRQVQLDRPVNVYTIGGTLVRQNATSLDGLPDGVYIVNGKKVLHRRKK